MYPLLVGRLSTDSQSSSWSSSSVRSRCRASTRRLYSVGSLSHSSAAWPFNGLALRKYHISKINLKDLLITEEVVKPFSGRGLGWAVDGRRPAEKVVLVGERGNAGGRGHHEGH